jgi:hypothetical protein
LAVRLEELSRICEAQNARRFAAPLMRGGQLSSGNLTKDRRNSGLPSSRTPGVKRDTRRMTFSLHEERASVVPFGDPDWHTELTPDRIAILRGDGTVVAERTIPAHRSRATR